jgi:hypothetical protein
VRRSGSVEARGEGQVKGLGLVGEDGDVGPRGVEAVEAQLDAAAASGQVQRLVREALERAAWLSIDPQGGVRW